MNVSLMCCTNGIEKNILRVSTFRSRKMASIYYQGVLDLTTTNDAFIIEWGQQQYLNAVGTFVFMNSKIPAT